MPMPELFGEEWLEALLLRVLVEVCARPGGLLDTGGIPAFEVAFKDLEYLLAIRKVQGRTIARLRKNGRAALRALARQEPELGLVPFAQMTKGERQAEKLTKAAS